MCLAIVKPMGISIPEEHLQNGWDNNDDGAGFVYIDPETKLFVVNKFMTYAAFIEKFNEANEAYGDVSDFLIHFRIASKGVVSIDNCHPFIVDEDRVIIHNGTMWNIDIDKKDKRSDTRVFAEDWLSQLPPDWEDNQIIHLLLEDFLGSTSKMCLLHRTKGIYIYNQDKGMWVDDIWYSNKSYEKRTYTAGFHTNSKNSLTTGFYSFLWQRMVTPEESKNMTKEEIEKHRSWDKYLAGKQSYVSSGHWTRCDLCGDYDERSAMIDMQGDHTGKVWCWDCYKSASTCSVCGKMTPDRCIDEYYNPDDGGTILICDDCVPNVNPIVIEKVDESVCK